MRTQYITLPLSEDWADEPKESVIHFAELYLSRYYTDNIEILLGLENATFDVHINECSIGSQNCVVAHWETDGPVIGAEIKYVEKKTYNLGKSIVQFCGTSLAVAQVQLSCNAFAESMREVASQTALSAATLENMMERMGDLRSSGITATVQPRDMHFRREEFDTEQE